MGHLAVYRTDGRQVPRTVTVFREHGHLGKEMPLAVRTGSNLATDSHIGKQTGHRVESFNDFGQQMRIGKYLLVLPRTFARIEAFSQMLMFEIETTEIRAAIQPGGALIIDSDNDALTARLGGNNILHLYKGAWIRLDRSSYMLDVHAATGGNLEAIIDYEDRYL